MPTYRNDTGTDIALDNFRAAARGGVISPKRRYSASAIAAKGLTVVSATPYYNPMIVSSVQTGDSSDTDDVAIPTTDNDGNGLNEFIVKVNCRAGAATIYLTAAANTPGRILKIGDTWEFRVKDRMVDNIHIDYTSDSSEVQVDVELL